METTILLNYRQLITRIYHERGESLEMRKTERIIPLAPLDRLIREAKAERVSEKASKELGEILEEIALEIATMAKDLAQHAHRKTINDSDIRLAFKQWKNK